VVRLIPLPVPPDTWAGGHYVSDWAESVFELSDNAILKHFRQGTEATTGARPHFEAFPSPPLVAFRSFLEAVQSSFWSLKHPTAREVRCPYATLVREVP
jgi:hypothetical protein